MSNDSLYKSSRMGKKFCFDVEPATIICILTLLGNVFLKSDITMKNKLICENIQA